MSFQTENTRLTEEFEGGDDVSLVLGPALEHVEHGHLRYDVILSDLLGVGKGRRHIQVDAVVHRESGKRLGGADFLRSGTKEKRI